MQAFLEKTFYGNTVVDWLVALGVMIAAVAAGKALYWVFGNLVRQLTKRTKTKLDDLILDMIEEPIVFALTIGGVWYGFHTLALPETAQQWVGNIVQVLVVLSIAWLLTRLLDAVFQEYLVPITEKTETDLDDQLLPIVRKGTKMAVWTIGAIVALNNAGYDVGALSRTGHRRPRPRDGREGYRLERLRRIHNIHRSALQFERPHQGGGLRRHHH